MSIKLMSAAFNADLRPAQKLVLLALCDCANDRGECFPSITTLVRKSSSGERTIQRVLSELEESGYVKREFRNGRVNFYSISIPDEMAQTPARAAPPPERHPRHSDTTGVPERHPGGARAAPITIREPSLKPNTTLEVSRAQLQADGLTPETADALVAHRKAKKAKLSAIAWNGFKREALKAGWTLEAAVEKTIERNWVGFDAEWVKPGKQTQDPWRGVE